MTNLKEMDKNQVMAKMWKTKIVKPHRNQRKSGIAVVEGTGDDQSNAGMYMAKRLTKVIDGKRFLMHIPQKTEEV